MTSPLGQLMAEINKQPKSTCKGGVYRAVENIYIGGKGEYVVTQKMIPLKRDSCSGCDNCWNWEDTLYDFVNSETPIEIRPEFRYNAKYKLEIVNPERDWETGMIDQYDLAFIMIKGIP